MFEASDAGQTTLELEPHSGTWFLEDVTTQPTPIGLTVTIIPEPSALLLAAALALALGTGHRSLGQVREGWKRKKSVTIADPGEATDHG